MSARQVSAFKKYIRAHDENCMFIHVPILITEGNAPPFGVLKMHLGVSQHGCTSKFNYSTISGHWRLNLQGLRMPASQAAAHHRGR